MLKTMLLFLTFVIIFLPVEIRAGQKYQDLGVCFTDSLSGKERKYLAKWIYFAISSHSTINPYSNVTKLDIDEANKYVGALVTRLLTEDCSEIAKAAVKEGGASALEYAFGLVGEVAMQELMAETSVSESLQGFAKHLDHKKFDEVFR